MTAHELVQEIFSRPQQHVASNVRYITERQFNWLRDLIGADDEGAAVKSGMNGGLVWMPSGQWKYTLSYDPASQRRTIMKLGAGRATDAGTLFG